MSEVIPKLLSTYRSRRFEPNWGITRVCIDAAQRLNVSNYDDIAAALGATNSPAEEVRRVRNFVVHPTKETASELRSKLGLRPLARVDAVAFAGRYVTGGVTAMELWVRRYWLVAAAAIQ